jgi:hypothetical protein
MMSELKETMGSWIEKVEEAGEMVIYANDLFVEDQANNFSRIRMKRMMAYCVIRWWIDNNSENFIRIHMDPGTPSLPLSQAESVAGIPALYLSDSRSVIASAIAIGEYVEWRLASDEVRVFSEGSMIHKEEGETFSKLWELLNGNRLTPILIKAFDALIKDEEWPLEAMTALPYTEFTYENWSRYMSSYDSDLERVEMDGLCSKGEAILSYAKKQVHALTDAGQTKKKIEGIKEPIRSWMISDKLQREFMKKRILEEGTPGIISHTMEHGVTAITLIFPEDRRGEFEQVAAIPGRILIRDTIVWFEN